MSPGKTDPMTRESPDFQIAADLRCTVGEGPVWHPGEGRLYWTDILSSRIYWHEPANGESRLCYEGRMVGGMTLQADGSLLLFMDRGTVAVWRDGGIAGTLLDHIPAEADRRFNDVIADPEGRVFAGAMPFKDLDRKKARLYRLDRDGSYEVVLEGIGIPNGMAFTCDRRSFYFIDSLDNVVWKFDYDPRTGAIGRRRDFLRFDPELDGHADGMTVDKGTTSGSPWPWAGKCSSSAPTAAGSGPSNCRPGSPPAWPSVVTTSRISTSPPALIRKTRTWDRRPAPSSS